MEKGDTVAKVKENSYAMSVVNDPGIKSMFDKVNWLGQEGVVAEEVRTQEEEKIAVVVTNGYEREHREHMEIVRSSVRETLESLAQNQSELEAISKLESFETPTQSENKKADGGCLAPRKEAGLQ